MKNIFTKKIVRTLTLGEKLKSLRDEKRISLGEVSRGTKIQVKYLQHLESGEYDKLPVDVYVKGFLRGYAQFLGVDDAILMRLYEKEKGIINNLQKKDLPKNGTAKKKIDVNPFLITPKVLFFIFTGLVFLGGIFYLYREFDSFANTPKLVIINPAPNSTEQDNSVFVEGVTDKDAKVFINNQPILVSDEGRFGENLVLQSGANKVQIMAVNRFEKTQSEELIVWSDFQLPEEKNNKDQDSEISAEQGKLSLEIRVEPGPVWVSVEVDGNLVFSGTMLSGASQSFLAGEKIAISSGKANATHIKFQGKEVGALGKGDDSVRGVVFDKNTKY